MSIHVNLKGERYEMDRDGTKYTPNSECGICDGCGDDLDDDSQYFQDYGWLCAGCIDEMDSEEEGNED